MALIDVLSIAQGHTRMQEREREGGREREKETDRDTEREREQCNWLLIIRQPHKVTSGRNRESE